MAKVIRHANGKPVTKSEVAARFERRLNDPIFGRGELQDYTKEKLGFVKGKGQIIECPICHRNGIERRWKRGGGHVIHADQMVSMLGMLCNEIKSSCAVNKDVWPLPEVGA